MIKVESVTKRYGNLVAVNNVSLHIRGGEIYALVGANGAGKSTLMRMLVGISEADAGQLLICDEDLSRRLPTTKKHLGYLPEELLFYDQLTGREYLQLVAGLKEADDAQIPVELEFFGIAHAAKKLVGGYSLGMRKKLGLCAAMLGSPEVLILDEPLNGLDVEMMRKLRHRLESEREAGKAVLVSSHVMSFVERVSNRVGVMRLGKLVAEGTPDHLRQQTGLLREDFEDVFFQLAE
ncbi:MAG: ABC transporter ATP-binding protein [Acidobacteria bacterium]|nr:ABC transporter ATP-binding protein [Acidobacteriota bacterium]